MNILFLSYWDIGEPLTKATVYPHLRILQEEKSVSRIVFVNTERSSPRPVFKPDFPASKVIYNPLFSKNYKVGIFNKIYDFIYFTRQLNHLVRLYAVDLVIARGSPAGSLAYRSWRRMRVPFIVESFEPHADYMLESHVWHRLDPRYLFQKRWEMKQKKYARGLLPVAENYRAHLLREGVPAAKVITAPCTVDFDRFRFDPGRRNDMRKALHIGTGTVVGVYAGKFGGLYLEGEAIRLFEGAFRCYRDFVLVVLTPPEFHPWVRLQLQNLKLPEERILVQFVTNEAVPDYLAMSDFAYATYKPGFFKAFLSPVKIGEYWACGLPVVLTAGVGDESAVIEDQAAGVLFRPNDINTEALARLYEKLARIMQTPGHRGKISDLARAMRGQEKTTKAYHHFLYP